MVRFEDEMPGGLAVLIVCLRPGEDARIASNVQRIPLAPIENVGFAMGVNVSS